jgi:uncharacterized membrane protein YdbT with pleckstrin-like domain
MSYIDRNLLQDERILFRTKKSLIIFFGPVLLLIFSGVASTFMLSNQVLHILWWTPWLVTVLFWSVVGLNYLTSEFAVTNKRIMMREGFFTRHANEMRLNAISMVNVEQNLIGQVMNFGTVSINAFGAFDSYNTISQPSRFQRAVNEQIDNAISGK